MTTIRAKATRSVASEPNSEPTVAWISGRHAFTAKYMSVAGSFVSFRGTRRIVLALP
jgi:succinyl-CoA synthetase alpha subunit